MHTFIINELNTKYAAVLVYNFFYSCLCFFFNYNISVLMKMNERTKKTMIYDESISYCIMSRSFVSVKNRYDTF